MSLHFDSGLQRCNNKFVTETQNVTPRWQENEFLRLLRFSVRVANVIRRLGKTRTHCLGPMQCSLDICLLSSSLARKKNDSRCLFLWKQQPVKGDIKKFVSSTNDDVICLSHYHTKKSPPSVLFHLACFSTSITAFLHRTFINATVESCTSVRVILPAYLVIASQRLKNSKTLKSALKATSMSV